MSSANSAEKPEAHCSFCEKSFQEVGPLVEGKGHVYICGECVELMLNIIDEEKSRRISDDPLAYFRFRIERIIGLMEKLKFELDPRIFATRAQSPKAPGGN